jgi:hypothetical protein
VRLVQTTEIKRQASAQHDPLALRELLGEEEGAPAQPGARGERGDAVKNRQALSTEASGAPRRRLIDLHADEFATLLGDEREARGLPRERGYQRAITKKELAAEVERLRAELAKEREVPEIIKANRRYMGKTARA